MLRFVCIVAALAGCLAVGPAIRPAGPYTANVADLAVDPANISRRWVARPALIIEDPRNPPKVAQDQAELLTSTLEMMDAGKIASAAIFSYGTAREKAFDVLTLSVYVFPSDSTARQWWTRSYRFHGWQKHYRPVDGYGDESIDSLRTNTRIVRQGNVVLVCGQTIGWDASHRVLGLECEKLRSLCQIAAPTTQPEEAAMPEE